VEITKNQIKQMILEELKEIAQKIEEG